MSRTMQRLPCLRGPAWFVSAFRPWTRRKLLSPLAPAHDTDCWSQLLHSPVPAHVLVMCDKSCHALLPLAGQNRDERSKGSLQAARPRWDKGGSTNNLELVALHYQHPPFGLFAHNDGWPNRKFIVLEENPGIDVASYLPASGSP